MLPPRAAPSAPARWLREEDVPLWAVRAYEEGWRTASGPVQTVRRPVQMDELKPSLKGEAVEVYWPEDDRWYRSEV